MLAAGGCKGRGAPKVPPPAPKSVAAPAPAPADAAVARTRPVPKPPLPGLSWQTPHQPFRLGFSESASALDGDTLLVAGYGGRLVRVDLATGEIVEEHDLGTFNVTSLLRLDARDWLAVGVDDHRTTAMTLDVDTLAPTRVPLEAKDAPDAYRANAARLPDGMIAIGGHGVPLASYDPATWQLHQVFDPARDWHGVAVRDDHVIGLGISNVEIDPATRDHRSLGYTFSLVAAGPYDAQWSTVEPLVVHDAAGRTVYRSAGIVSHAAFAAAGRLLVMVAPGSATIVEVATGKIVRTFSMPHAGHETFAQIAVDDRHLAFVGDGVVYVADLATGALSPEGAAPFGPSSSIRVDDAGVVLAVHVGATRFANGAVLAAASEAAEVWMTAPADDTTHLGTIGHGSHAPVTLLEVDPAGGTRTIASWISPQFIVAGWFGAHRDLVLEGSEDMDAADRDIPHRLLRSHGTRLVSVTSLAPLAEVMEVDVDAGVAVVELEGVLTLVDLRTGRPRGATQNTPACRSAAVALEPHGTRIVFWVDRDAYVWDRKTGRIVASLRAASPIERAAFVPGRAELILSYHDELARWAFETGTLGTAPVDAAAELGISPSGKWLALGGDDSRISVVDLARLRDGMSAAALPPAAALPASCPGGDPFKPE